MRRTISIVVLGGLTLAGSMGAECYGLGLGSATRFTATLSGDRAVPPVDSDGSGTGTFVLNAAETELSYDISASDLSGSLTAAHFHFSAQGANGTGDIVFDISDSITQDGDEVTLVGVWPLTAADLVNLRINYIYVNLHTGLNPGGEIRGNLTAE